MPELPDVQIFKEYLDATSLHKKIAAVEETDGRLLTGISAGRLARRLEGRDFSESHRHGKYLFARFGEENFLVLHFGMTGFLRSYRKEEKRPDHLGLLLRFADGSYLACISRRRLGRIFLSDSEEGFVEEHGLGPDALVLSRDRDGFAERLSGHRGTLKGLMMNQRVLAGIGNIYADEILYLAGRHPKSPAADLSWSELRRLAGKTRHVLETAIARRAGERGWPESWLLPRREEGKGCRRCGGTIEKARISGRATYFCPDHQR